MIRSVVLRLVWGFSILPALTLPSMGQDLEGRFALDKQTFLVDEPIFLNLEMVNRTGCTLILVRGDTSRDCCGFTFDLLQSPKADSPDCFVPFINCGRCGHALENLDPSQKIGERLLLNERIDISEPGRYRVHAQRTLGYGRTEEEAWRSSHAVALGDSAEFEFEVVPTDEPDRLRKAYQPLLTDLNSKDQAKRLAAAQVIGQIAPRALEREILALAAAKDSHSQIFVIDALRKLNTPATKAALFELASHGPEWIQSGAILNLGRTDDESFLSFLLAHAESEGSTGLQRSFLTAAAELGHAKTLPLLLSLIESSRLEERKNALLALPDAAGKESIPVLIRLLLDPDKDIRRLAELDLERLTHRTLAKTGSAEAHARWLTWWNREGAGADVPNPDRCNSYRVLD
jgi:hypothetical protein